MPKCSITAIGISAFLALAVYVAPLVGDAAQPSNILVMTDDGAPDTLSRGKPEQRALLGSLSEALSSHGLKVFDETSVTLEWVTQGRVRRPRAELVQVAREFSKPPMDVAVLVSARSSIRPTGFGTRLSVTGSATVIDLSRRRDLGTATAIPEDDVMLRETCTGPCVTTETAAAFRELAEKLGVGVSAILKRAYSRNGVATGFEVSLMSLETTELKMLARVILSEKAGLKDHRILRSSNVSRVYWIETTESADELVDRLERSLSMLDIRAAVTATGSKIDVRGIGQ
jgi:hypothetical protein